MRPKITIITPCFNAVKYIEQTILSILHQGYENLEYIIIDGGSNDGTVEIIKKYEDKLTYWVSEPDKGQSDAINKGIAMATGDVFNWINADDWLEANVLNEIGNIFSNKKVRVVCGETTFLNPDNSSYTNIATEFSGDVKMVLNTRGLNQMGMFWRLDLIKQLNGVNANFRFAMDLDLWKRYLLTFGNEGILKLDKCIGVFRLHADSKTGTDMVVNSSFFDTENNAALWQYAKVAGKKYLKGIQFLYPDAKQELCNEHPISELPADSIKKWLNDLFFKKATRLFYAYEFSKAYLLLKNIEGVYLPASDLTDFKSFKRWSFIKQYYK